MKIKKKKRVPIRAIALRALAGAGVVAIAVAAPNIVHELSRLDRATSNRKALYKRINQAISRLEADGMIELSGYGRERKVHLTEKGKAYIEDIAFDEYQIPEPAFWDGKWRVAMFDIAEKRKRVRVQMRTLLESAGFVKIQDSVWAYPYPCDEFIALLRAHLKSGVGELRMIEANALESDKQLRTHFRLD